MIRFLDIQAINASFQPGLSGRLSQVVASGVLIRGPEVDAFEREYAAFTGTRHCVGVGNGFDALQLIFRGMIERGLLHEGDEVIVPANTYIASVLALSVCRLVPVLAEPDPETCCMEAEAIAQRITTRTRAVLAVHLYGRCSVDERVLELCRSKKLHLVEDCAQAAGCFSGNRRVGSLGIAAAHSFFPTKNLGALGDAGAVTTDDADLASMVRTFGNYGSAVKGMNEVQGVNSRLDEIQAAVLRLKLERLDEDNARRRTAARYYLDNIRNSNVVLPVEPSSEDGHVWHLFVVRSAARDALQRHLAGAGVETMVHYPVPPHRQKAYHKLNGLSLPVTEKIHREVLSLPLHPLLRADDLGRVADAVNSFKP